MENMTENEAYLRRYAHELRENFSLHWPAISLYGRREGGSIEEFNLAWEGADKEYAFREACCFKKPNAANDVDRCRGAVYASDSA